MLDAVDLVEGASTPGRYFCASSLNPAAAAVKPLLAPGVRPDSTSRGSPLAQSVVTAANTGNRLAELMIEATLSVLIRRDRERGVIHRELRVVGLRRVGVAALPRAGEARDFDLVAAGTAGPIRRTATRDVSVVSALWVSPQSAAERRSRACSPGS